MTCLQHKREGKSQLLMRINLKKCLINISKKAEIKIESKYKNELSRQNKSCFVFSFDNNVRQICLRILFNPIFDYIIFLCVLINSITLTLAIDATKKDPDTEIFGVFEIIFNVIFTIEFIINVIALGFLPLNGNKNAYLSSSWNILDFIILIGSWIDYIISEFNENDGLNISLIRNIRILRLLKPLKMINYISPLKLQINVLISSLPAFLKIFLVLLFFLFICGIVLTQLLSGILRFRCVDNHGNTVINDNQLFGFCDPTGKHGGITCINDTKCMDVGGEQIVSNVLSFDNILKSCSTLLYSTLYSEFNVYYRIQEAAGHYYDILFLVIKLLLNHVILNIATATMLLNLKHEKNKYKEYIHLKLTDILKKKDDNENVETVKVTKFDVFIIICVIINTLILALEYHNMPDSLAWFLYIANLIFNIIYSIEMIVKIYSLGFKKYLSDAWNVFDAIIVIIGWIDFIFSDAVSISSLKTLRILRLFKLIKFFSSLKTTILSIFTTFDELKYSFFLLGLFVFLFGLIGFQLFNDKFIDPNTNELYRYNFSSFSWSCITVFKVLLSSWDNTLFYLIDASPLVGVIYFFSMVTIGSIILLSLFLAVLFDNFILAKSDKSRQFNCNCMSTTSFQFDNIPYNRPIKILSMTIVESKYFQHFIFCFNIFSCAILVFDEPDIDQSSGLFIFIIIAEILVLIIFIAEMAVKIIASSFIEYIMNQHNVLAMSVIIISLFNLIFNIRQTEVQALRIILSFKALRVLKLIDNNKNITIVADAIWTLIPKLMGLIIVGFIVFFSFGIIFLQQFNGLYYACFQYDSASNTWNLLENNDKIDCYSSDMDTIIQWRHYNLGDFDNIFSSFLTLFESTITWSDKMLVAIDSNGVDRAPKRDNNVHYSLFFIAYLIISVLFIQQLLSTATLVQFRETYETTKQNAFMTPYQQEVILLQTGYFDVFRNQLLFKIVGKKHVFRRIILSNTFEKCILGVVIVNTIIMCMDYYNAPETYTYVLTVLNDIALFIFLFECIAKIWAFDGIKNYLVGSWNKFDFIVVVISTTMFIIRMIGVGSVSLNVVRAFRALRALRIIGMTDLLRKLLTLLIVSIPGVYNIVLLLTIIYVTFALLGMNLFHGIQYSQYITIHSNFDSFYTGLLTLIEMNNNAGVFREIFSIYPITAFLFYVIFYILSIVTLALFISTVKFYK